MKQKRPSRPADADPDAPPEERIFDDDPQDGNLALSPLDGERLEELFDIRRR